MAQIRCEEEWKVVKSEHDKRENNLKGIFANQKEATNGQLPSEVLMRTAVTFCYKYVEIYVALNSDLLSEASSKYLLDFLCYTLI